MEKMLRMDAPRAFQRNFKHKNKDLYIWSQYYDAERYKYDLKGCTGY